jgi:hypothetical protein
MAQKGSKKTVKKAARKVAVKRAARPAKRAPLRAKTAKPARPTRLGKATKKATASAKAATKSAKKTVVRARKVLARKARPRPAAPKALAKPVKKAAPARSGAAAASARPASKPKTLAPPKRAVALPPPNLQRERRRLPEAEEESFNDVSGDSRLMSSARAGHDELRSEMKKHTESSPVLTAGDVDAKWQDAYALGDEAPGGDNMTPGQDRVDDIGKALGIEYADDEELLGGDEILERDEHRWELDPASKDDEEDL